MRKTKAKLILTLSVALLSVLTMSVTTFAWFQAQAEVNIRTEGDSTTITVSKPDSYVFYAYSHNGLSTYGTTTNDGATTSDFEADFTTITSGNISTLTSLDGLNPGQSMVYAVKVPNTVVGRAVTLKISSLISNTSIKQGYLYHRYHVANENAESGTEMNVGWAIDVYSMSSANGSGYKSFLTATNLTDKFAFGKDALGQLNNDGTGSAPNKVISLSNENKIEIYNANATATTTYVFYRIYYSDNVNTFFKEINPKGYNVETVGANRRFLYAGDATGTSNCYGGLKFQLTTIDLTF